jgi:hypothetical protein
MRFYDQAPHISHDSSPNGLNGHSLTFFLGFISSLGREIGGSDYFLITPSFFSSSLLDSSFISLLDIEVFERR